MEPIRARTPTAGETPRNRSMFGPPGHLYAYRSYGVHTCANVVCEARGRGAAVLLRALEPTPRRSSACAPCAASPQQAPERLIASGPGRLAQALGITLAHDGCSLLRGALVLHGRAGRPSRAHRGERADRADAGAELRVPLLRLRERVRQPRPARSARLFQAAKSAG